MVDDENDNSERSSNDETTTTTTIINRQLSPTFHTAFHVDVWRRRHLGGVMSLSEQPRQHLHDQLVHGGIVGGGAGEATMMFYQTQQQGQQTTAQCNTTTREQSIAVSARATVFDGGRGLRLEAI
jgi:hypothetical protein